MSLVAEAEKAEDIAAGFSKFLSALPDQATEVTALISELYAISSALRDLDTTVQSREYGLNVPLIEKDLELVRLSLAYTLKDVFDKFGDVDTGPNLPTIGAYRQIWKDIWIHFKTERRGTLCERLENYRRFILELGYVMKRNPPDQRSMGKLRGELKTLLIAQDERLAEDFGGMSLGVGRAGPIPKRSYERERPQGSPQSSSSQRSYIPPHAPEVPLSPTTTTSTTVSSSMASGDHHWAQQVWLRDVSGISATPLPGSGNLSKCYGEHMPDARLKLEAEYDELFQLKFGGDGGLAVRLYLREEDHRARILCKTPHSSGRNFYSCLPLNTLEIHRSDSSLRLCRRIRGESKLELWANLKFTTVERLVLFYCTFMAMRSQDSGKPIREIDDHNLAGEREIFGGKIVDDNYLHGLRVFLDRHSKAVRLQASVMTGELTRTPVWTAFITHHLASRSWLAVAGTKRVLLRDLRRYVFTSVYTPQTTARGEHVLDFKTEHDAVAFMKTIHDLAAIYRR